MGYVIVNTAEVQRYLGTQGKYPRVHIAAHRSFLQTAHARFREARLCDATAILQRDVEDMRCTACRKQPSQRKRLAAHPVSRLSMWRDLTAPGVGGPPLSAGTGHVSDIWNSVLWKPQRWATPPLLTEYVGRRRRSCGDAKPLWALSPFLSAKGSTCLCPSIPPRPILQFRYGSERCSHVIHPCRLARLGSYSKSFTVNQTHWPLRLRWL